MANLNQAANLLADDDSVLADANDIIPLVVPGVVGK